MNNNDEREAAWDIDNDTRRRPRSPTSQRRNEVSEVNEQGILMMPYDMAMGDELSRMQFWSRAQLAYKELVQARAALAQQQVPQGWRLVPVEPNEALVRRVMNHGVWTQQEVRNLYADIVSAAPPAPQAEQPRQMVGLTDEQINRGAKEAFDRGELSWLGFEKDDSGVYCVPVLSIAHHQLSRAAIAKFCEVNGIPAPKEPT